MRVVVVAVLLAFVTACELPWSTADSMTEISKLKVEQSKLEDRVLVLEARLAALEGPTVGAVPLPAPLVLAAPSPRPLVVPAVPAPVPAPAPVVPTGPVGKVTVSSPRDGLAIWVDGSARAETTPAVILLSAGRHRVRVEGYDEQEIKVIDGESVLVVPR